MTAVDCFWVEDTGEVDVSLRRYVSGSPCPAGGGQPAYGDYCNESVRIGRRPQERDEKGYLTELDPADFADVERWPTHCTACGRELGRKAGTGERETKAPDGATIRHQINQDPIYRRPDTGEEWPMRHLPPGAMFDATWLHDESRSPETSMVGSDGIALMVVCPYTGDDARGTFWNVDGFATSADPNDRSLKYHAWTRTGDPKAPGSVTANPSINIVGTYHGWLRDGQLIPC